MKVGRTPVVFRLETKDPTENVLLVVNRKGLLFEELIQRKYSKTAARLVPFYTDRVEKPGGSRKVEFQDIFGLLSEEKASFTVAGSGILLSSICSLAIPTIFGNVIDAFSLDQEIIEVLKTSALQLFGIAIVNGIATFVKSSTLDLIGQKVGMRLRRRLFTTIITQNVSFFDENTSGELANRISHDVHEVAEHLVEHTSMFLTASVHTIIASSYLVCISPSLSSITLMVFPTICVGAVFYGRYVEIFSRQYLNALANSTQTATEKFSAIKTVRSFSGEKVEMKRFGKQIDEALSFARYWCYLEGFYLGSIAAISAGTMLAVIWYGSDMVLSKILSVGNLASYALYAQELNNSTIDLTEGIAGIMRAKGSASRVFELLSHNNPQKSGNYIPKGGIRGVIEFRNVNFAFPRRPSLTVLHNFSLVLDAGQKICITGKSGCGKSTILELLEGFYDSYEGGIYVDDVNLRNYDPSWLRNQIISVRQDVALFTGTIYENICYGLPKSSIEDVQNAARISLVHDFIVSLPLGYDTMVGERSGQLSGGQRQRIAVARAILMKPKVLLLDEVTSAQDSVNEEDLIGSVLRQVDRVVVLENGNVTLTGTYDKVKSSLHSTGG